MWTSNLLQSCGGPSSLCNALMRLLQCQQLLLPSTLLLLCSSTCLASELGGACQAGVSSHLSSGHMCLPHVQYYDDAAGILRSIILSAIAPHRLATAPPKQLVQSPSQEVTASQDFDRQATEELPSFLPYAAVDSTDEFEERCLLVAF